MKPVREVVQESHRFLSDLVPKLGKRIVSELNATRGQSKLPRGSAAHTHEDVVEILESTSLEQLSTRVAYELREVQAADAELEGLRSTGLRRAGVRFQQFALAFDKFLRAYSGIVNIIEGADSQYGNVASATLSLLFAVSMRGSSSASLVMTDANPDRESKGRGREVDM